MCLLAAGFVSVFVAVSGIEKHGEDGILKPALWGLLLQILTVTILIPNYQVSYEAGEARRMGEASITMPAPRR